MTVIKHRRPMLYKGKPSTFPTFAEQVYGPDGEPLVKGGRWNLPTTYNIKGSKLLYRDNTFADDYWHVLKPIGADYENNALIMEDASVVPPELSPTIYRCAIGLIPGTKLRYGNLPIELYNTDLHRCKNIGDNKIQFYKVNGELIEFTENEAVDLSHVYVLYSRDGMFSARPSVTNLPRNHRIHARLTAVGYLAPSMGIDAFNAQGEKLTGFGYGDINKCYKRSLGFALLNDASCSIKQMDFDAYTCLVGSRGIGGGIQGIPGAHVLGVFDVVLWPDSLVRGYKYYATSDVLSVNTGHVNNVFAPYFGFNIGVISDFDVNELRVYPGNVSNIGPGSCFEVWDEGEID